MNEWRKIKLGDISHLVTSGSRGWAKFYAEDGAKFIRMTNLPRHGIRLLQEDLKFVKLPVGSSEGSRTKLQQHDVLISITAELGKIGYISEKVGDGYINQHIALVRIDADKANPKLIAYALSTDRARWSFNRSNDPGAKAGLNLTNVRNFSLLLPGITEQDQISEVLETWDDYILMLESMITLKRKLERSLLMRLLAGKNRFAIFDDNWTNVSLGAISKIKTGDKDNQDKVKGGEYPFYVRSPRVERINSYSFDGEAILVPGEGNIGKIFHYVNGKFDFHQRVYAVTNFVDGVSGKYIYYYFLKYFSKQAEKHSVKATVDSLRLPTFQSFEISIPSYEEQMAIVSILDTASSEITALLTLKMNVESEKKYLLKNLISGKIRTPVRLASKGTN